MLNELLPSLTTSENHKLNDPACPTLRSIVIVDNTGKGTKQFETLLETESLAGHDFRRLFEWDGDGLQGAEESDRHDVINLQFTSYISFFPFSRIATDSFSMNNNNNDKWNNGETESRFTDAP